MNINANALLAIGASPLMSFCPEEMEEIVRISSALVVNIGCLDRQEIEAMEIAAASAHCLGKPWVLDPVGAGASNIRTQTALSLIRDSHPTVIRGNASEILCLAGEQINSRGVDSSALSSDAVEGAKALALSSGAVVSVSGPVDYTLLIQTLMKVQIHPQPRRCLGLSSQVVQYLIVYHHNSLSLSENVSPPPSSLISCHTIGKNKNFSYSVTMLAKIFVFHEICIHHTSSV